jgi:hypothetical protein
VAAVPWTSAVVHQRPRKAVGCPSVRALRALQARGRVAKAAAHRWWRKARRRLLLVKVRAVAAVCVLLAARARQAQGAACSLALVQDQSV